MKVTKEEVKVNPTYVYHVELSEKEAEFVVAVMGTVNLDDWVSEFGSSPTIWRALTHQGVRSYAYDVSSHNNPIRLKRKLAND